MARVFGQAPKFLPKIQALCLCRAPFAFPHFAKVGKWQYLYFDRGDKGISGMQRLDKGIL